MAHPVEREAHDERNFVKKGVSWRSARSAERRALHCARRRAPAARLATSTVPAERWIGKDALRAFAKPPRRRPPVAAGKACQPPRIRAPRPRSLAARSPMLSSFKPRESEPLDGPWSVPYERPRPPSDADQAHGALARGRRAEGDGVLPGEARVAVTAALLARGRRLAPGDRVDHPLEREVPERVSGDVARDLPSCGSTRSLRRVGVSMP